MCRKCPSQPTHGEYAPGEGRKSVRWRGKRGEKQKLDTQLHAERSEDGTYKFMGLPSKTLLATDKIGDASVQSQKGKLSGYLAGAAPAHENVAPILIVVTVSMSMCFPSDKEKNEARGTKCRHSGKSTGASAVTVVDLRLASRSNRLRLRKKFDVDAPRS